MLVSSIKTALQNAKSLVFVAYLDPEIHANKELSLFSSSKKANFGIFTQLGAKDQRAAKLLMQLQCQQDSSQLRYCFVYGRDAERGNNFSA